MSKFIRFPSIESFRHTCGSVKRHTEFVGLDEAENPIYDLEIPKPKIEFTGTVKLHGTNAGVCWNGEDLWVQSRTRVITTKKDNAGFAFFVEANRDLFLDLMRRIKIAYQIQDEETIVVYGEWCGTGIQKGVALETLPKMFVIFKVKIATPGEKEENFWINGHTNLMSEELSANQIYFIQQFPTYKMVIDFEHPEEAQNQLVELTEKVEQECPVAKHFGTSGVGEGIVWSGSHAGNSYLFKVKGDKHSVTKVKKLASIDIEKVNSIDAFVEYAVTENRLLQAVQEVFTAEGKEIQKSEIEPFLRWLQQDIIKEEMDTLVGNNLEPRDVNGAMSKKAVRWLTKTYGL